ncbi:YcxB family protein [Konateibacter massiliensis]|uniref:YcxB family protein n=1 Tax=Konateibacter massiliensis TaxID=2002841 RepID=UPI000C14B3C4|nr:YcxB family protein [Konateibacter massiliensis]
MKEIKIDTKINVGDMYNFYLHHTYSGIGGLISIVFGLAMFVVAAYTYGDVPQGHSVIYIIFGFFFLFFNPINYYLKAVKVVKTTPTYKEPISYHFHDEGITTSQKEESTTIKWEDVQQITASRRSVLIYMTKQRANIIPRRAIGENYEDFAAVVTEKLEPSKIKLKQLK